MSFGIKDPVSKNLEADKANRDGSNISNPAGWRQALELDAGALDPSEGPQSGIASLIPPTLTLLINADGSVSGSTHSAIPANWKDGQASLTGLQIGNYVTAIGINAFNNCSGFTGPLLIPHSVQSIGSGAFSNCGFDGPLIMGDSLATIPDNAFSNCSNFIGSLVIPDSVTAIGDYAFAGCEGFEGSLVIPESIASVGSHAFAGCSGLSAASIYLPKPVIDAATNCFAGTSITTIRARASDETWTASPEDTSSPIIPLASSTTTPALNSEMIMMHPAASHQDLDALAALGGGDSVRWSTSANRIPGMWYQVKMLGLFPVSAFRLYTSASNDYPYGLKVYSTSDITKFRSSNYAEWTEIANIPAGSCSADMTVTFPETTDRVFAFVQQGSGGGWWSITSLVPTFRGQDYAASGHALLSAAEQANWTATASKNSAQASRGIAQDSLVWSSNGVPVANDWFMVDMGGDFEVSEIEFFSTPSAENYIDQYEIYYTLYLNATSDSGTFSSWTKIPSGKVTSGSPRDLPARVPDWIRYRSKNYLMEMITCRKIAIRVITPMSGRWWNIDHTLIHGKVTTVGSQTIGGKSGITVIKDL